MQRLQSSAALAVSVIALFVALGGSALAISQIGTSQIQNGAVTTPKLANGAVTTRKLANNAVTNSKLANNAVTNSKIANNAVTGAKVADGSLTASDIAANTFLAANGTAADSSRLGGLLPTDFVQGVGIMEDRRIVVSAGTSGAVFLNTLFGSFTGNCSAGNQPSVSWSPTVSNAEYAANVLVFGAAPKLVTLNGIPAGGSDPEPNPAVGPFQTTYQIAFTSGGLDHAATAWITGRFEFGIGCVFTGQELSSG
jgi:hypothetical protein